jgi:hypothetical protein
MVYGVRCKVYGVWCMVYGTWCMVYGAWCVVYGIWWMVYEHQRGEVVLYSVITNCTERKPLAKLIVSQTVTNFPLFCGIQWLITLFTEDRHSPLAMSRRMNPVDTSHCFAVRSI